jgi:hypothetical protein
MKPEERLQLLCSGTRSMSFEVLIGRVQEFQLDLLM